MRAAGRAPISTPAKWPEAMDTLQDVCAGVAMTLAFCAAVFWLAVLA